MHTTSKHTSWILKLHMRCSVAFKSRPPSKKTEVSILIALGIDQQDTRVQRFRARPKVPRENLPMSMHTL